MESGVQKKSSKNENASSFQISCSDVPDELFDRVAAKDYFQQFGRVLRLFLRPKSKTCTIEYDSAESAERALQDGGVYNGSNFFVGWTLKKPKVKKKRLSKSEEELDPAWPVDPEVQQELEAMNNAFTVPRKYILRPEAMKVDSPAGPSKVLKKTVLKKVVKKACPKSKVPEKVKPAIKNEPKKPVKPISAVDTAVVNDFLNIIKQPAHTADEKFRVLEARDKVIRMYTIKQVDIAKATKTVGTCPDMCPEKERLMRESQHQVALYEQMTNSRGEYCMNHRAAIKQYSRSSADQDVPLPHELRPVDVLHLSMNYILLKLVDLCDTPDVNLAEWYHFIWDRTRGIRKDITQQELCCKRSVELVERCARFHIHCSARLVAEDTSVFDQKINTENLTKCLQSLKYMYHDLELEGEKCPNEAEFRGYIVLLNLNDGNFMWEVKNLRNEIQKSPEVRFAIRVFFALDNNNYVSFFKLVRSATYLNACILLRYFNQVRYKAIERILRTHSPRTTTAAMSVDELKHMLAFENIESTVSFLNYHGLNLITNANQVVLNRRALINPTLPFGSQRSIDVIESKRVSSVGEIIYGSKLPSIDFDAHVPNNSFDENGFLKKAEVDESWKKQPVKAPAPDEPDKNIKPLFAKNDLWDSPLSIDKVDSKTTVQKSPNAFPVRAPFETKVFGTADTSQRNSPILKQEVNIFAPRTDSPAIPAKFPSFASPHQPFMTMKPASAVPNIFKSPAPFKIDPKQSKSDVSQELKSENQDETKSENVDKKPENIFKIPQKSDVYTFSEPDSYVPPVGGLFSRKVPPKESQFELKGPETARTSFTASFSKPITQPKLDTKLPGFMFELNAPKTSTDADRLREEAARIETERKRREMIEKEKEEARRRLEEEEERKRKLKEEEIRKEEERKKEERRRQEEEWKRIEEERKRLEEEQKRIEEQRLEEMRARIIRQMELQRQRVERERQEEIERIRSVRALIDTLVARTEESERSRKLAEIRENLKRIALKQLLVKWRRKVSLMKRKRKAVDDLPTWMSRRSITDEAAELCSNSQRLVLSDMKRYKLGTHVRLILPDLPKAKRIDIETLMCHNLRARLNNQNRMVNSLFWNVKVSLPDRNESRDEAERLEDVVDMAFGITETHEQTVVQRTEVYGSFAFAVEKQIGAFVRPLDEKFDVLFVGVDNAGSIYSLRTRLSSILKRKSDLDPIPVAIVLRRGKDSTDIDSLEDLLDLKALKARDAISTYKILYDETGTDESLSIKIEEGLKELATHTTDPPPLEVNYFHTVLCNCIGTELSDRLRSCTKTNRKFESALSLPQIVIGIHNEALSKLCEIITEDVSGYPKFPGIFSEYLDEETAFPKGYEYISNYLLSRRYRDDVITSLEVLILPEFKGWPPEDTNGLRESLTRFCRQSIVGPTSDNVFLRVWASVLGHLERSVDGATLADRLDGFPWLDIVQIIVAEKLNRIDYNIRAPTDNRLHFKTVVYDRTSMVEFRNNYWWYEMDLVCDFIQSTEEPDEESFDVQFDEEDSKIEFDLDKSLAEAKVVNLDEPEQENPIDYVGFKRMLKDLETSISIQRKAQQKFDDILKREIPDFGN